MFESPILEFHRCGTLPAAESNGKQLSRIPYDSPKLQVVVWGGPPSKTVENRMLAPKSSPIALLVLYDEALRRQALTTVNATSTKSRNHKPSVPHTARIPKPDPTRCSLYPKMRLKGHRHREHYGEDQAQDQLRALGFRIFRAADVCVLQRFV